MSVSRRTVCPRIPEQLARSDGPILLSATQTAALAVLVKRYVRLCKTAPREQHDFLGPDDTRWAPWPILRAANQIEHALAGPRDVAYSLELHSDGLFLFKLL